MTNKYYLFWVRVTLLSEPCLNFSAVFMGFLKIAIYQAGSAWLLGIYFMTVYQ